MFVDMHSCRCDHWLSWYKDITCMFDQSHSVHASVTGTTFQKSVQQHWIFMFFIPSISRAALRQGLTIFSFPVSGAVGQLCVADWQQCSCMYSRHFQHCLRLTLNAWLCCTGIILNHLCTSLEKRRPTFGGLWFSTTDKVSQEGAVCCFVRGSADVPLDSLKQTLKCPHTKSQAAEQPGDCVN